MKRYTPTFADRENIWRSSGLSPTARIAALELSTYMDYETGLMGKGYRRRLTEQLGLSQSYASRVLKELKGHGVIKGRRLIFKRVNKVTNQSQVTNQARVTNRSHLEVTNQSPAMSTIGHIKGDQSVTPYKNQTTSQTRRETVEPTERARSSGSQSSEAGEALASDTSRLWDEWIEQSQPPPPAQPPQELTEEERGRQLAAELTRPWGADHAEEVRRFHEKMDALEGRQRNG